jgi:hypothetical protein
MPGTNRCLLPNRTAPHPCPAPAGLSFFAGSRGGGLRRFASAAGAVSDLASTRFAIEDLATKLLGDAFEQQDGTHDNNQPLHEFACDVLNVANELLGDIVKAPSHDEERLGQDDKALAQ